MKKHLIALIGATALIASGGTTAADLSFAFHVPLSVTQCVGLDGCFDPPDSAAIFVELEINDPYAAQDWGPSDVISWGVSSAFPSISALEAGEVPVPASFTGRYAPDAASGFAEANLDVYSIEATVMDATVRINGAEWLYVIDRGTRYIYAVPASPTAAYTMVGAVPLPAAAYMFITALAGLFGAKRVARRRQVAV